MEREHIIRLTDKSMKENGRMVKSVEMEYTTLVMAADMKESGEVINS